MSLKSVNLAPGEIYYYELGSGPDLLFLHGVIATSTAYLPLLNLLAKHYHVIAPIHPGHGRSGSAPENWKANNFANFYVDFVNDLNLQPKVIIGHSFGGLITLLLVNYFPDARIIVMNSPCLPFDFQPGTYMKMMFSEAAEILKKKTNLTEIKNIATASGSIIETIIEHPEDIPFVIREAPKLDLTEEILKIKRPIDIFWGRKDEIVPTSIAGKLQEMLPQARLHIFPDKNHNYSVTEPEFTYQEINKVLDAS